MSFAIKWSIMRVLFEMASLQAQYTSQKSFEHDHQRKPKHKNQGIVKHRVDKHVPQNTFGSKSRERGHRRVAIVDV